MGLTPLPGAYGGADPLFLLLVALAVEAYVGDRPFRFRWTPNPRRALAALVHDLERRLDRPERGPAARRVRGAIVAAVLALLALAVGWAAETVTRNYPFAWVIELFLLIALLAQRGTWRHGVAVAAGLDSGSPIRAREALRPLAIERLDAAEIDALPASAIVESALDALGRRFADGLVGPVFWYVLLGLPGLFLQQTAYVMGLLAARVSGPYARAPAALHAGLALVPSYLAGFLLAAAAAFVPGGRPLAALRVAARGRPGAGAALAAGLAAVPGPHRLTRGLSVFMVACLIDGGLLALLALVRLTFF